MRTDTILQAELRPVRAADQGGRPSLQQYFPRIPEGNSPVGTHVQVGVHDPFQPDSQQAMRTVFMYELETDRMTRRKLLYRKGSDHVFHEGFFHSASRDNRQTGKMQLQ